MVLAFWLESLPRSVYLWVSRVCEKRSSASLMHTINETHQEIRKKRFTPFKSGSGEISAIHFHFHLLLRPQSVSNWSRAGKMKKSIRKKPSTINNGMIQCLWLRERHRLSYRAILSSPRVTRVREYVDFDTKFALIKCKFRRVWIYMQTKSEDFTWNSICLVRHISRQCGKSRVSMLSWIFIYW